MAPGGAMVGKLPHGEMTLPDMAEPAQQDLRQLSKKAGRGSQYGSPLPVIFQLLVPDSGA
ncbi:hypothetical protein WM43_04235 [Aeromonas veronii]|uniref:Uncharacterized protein n=2 Tax=Aeromonas veronii TaxID=654 RepID=A0AAC9B5I2_AERVE|nr:hypothetical protein WM43_04235 [Aeromonas veronii]